LKRELLRIGIIVWVAGMLLAHNQSMFAEEKPTWQYGLSFSYLTGDYGTDENTDILYAAAGIKRYFEKGDFTATFPYLSIPNDGVIFIDGGAEPVEGAGGGSGLGDIILKGRYYAVEQNGPLPFIDLVGSLKLPTASREKGLGTGKADFTMGAEIASVLPDRRWIILGELGYTFVGNPPGYETNNRWLYSIGLSYECSTRMRFSGYLDGRTAVFQGNDNPLSILLIGEYRIHSSLRLDTMLEVGMNDGAPEIGVTIGLRRRI
jgi:hypothetical protein